MTLADFWRQMLTLLQAQLTEQQFRNHIAPLTVGEEGEAWVIYAKNQFAANLVRNQYARVMDEARAMIAEDVPPLAIKAGVGVHYAPLDVDNSYFRQPENEQQKMETKAVSGSLQAGEMEKTAAESISGSPKNKTPSAQDILAERLNNLRPQKSVNSDKQSEKTSEKAEKSAIAAEKSRQAVQQKFEQTNLSPDYTFEALVVGKGNQLPAAVAHAIAEKPGESTYNPFFIYGSTGLGKTHLAQAIGHDLLQRNPKARVHYIHSDAYVKNLMATVKNHSWDAFKQKYLNYDLLIIDDIQFIAGKERTMEEFFFLFEHFYNHKQQIILTCDQLPSGLEKMDDRLKSRFSWGMTLPIEPPELEMRIGILERKAQTAGMILEDDAALLIAQNVKKSVRDLEGALNRLVARCRFERRNVITQELAAETLSDVIASNYKPITVELIMKTVADRYHISIRDILGKKRSRNLARPRQMAMALTKELTQLSLPAIGDAFGGRDHTTVMHAVKTINELRETEPEWQRDYNELLILIQH
ncbi:chromosomal replication initiator protein DnaA [Neisseriaceae bacterium B1]